MCRIMICTVILAMIMSLSACNASEPIIDSAETTSNKTAIFAGGCFWCVEAGLEKITGVTAVVSGYSGGTVKNPKYKTYNKPKAGQKAHEEVVKVYYDDAVINYESLVEALFRNIDPTDAGGQFRDRGPGYRPAIYYANVTEKKIAQQAIKKFQKYYDKPIALKIFPATTFYKAEKYHQDFYKKSPLRYAYYSIGSGRPKYLKKIWGKAPKFQARGNGSKQEKLTMRFRKPSQDEIHKKLTDLQYKVTQEEGTERPFANEYWDNKQEGIYVDIVTGEPLFSSLDKYSSGTGWPSFTKPIAKDALTEKEDRRLFASRTEVRSLIGDSHLGHVFKDGPQDKGGLRYCVNSASLRFIPKEKLTTEGYAHYSGLFGK